MIPQLNQYKLDCAGRCLDLSYPRVMGILNVTPDSFSDGGLFLQAEHALQHALRMMREGAAIVDIGGVSSRPGSKSVSLAAELDRVIPIIELLYQEMDIPLSVDTCKPEVMSEAMKAGAGFVNDIKALSAPGAMQAVCNAKVGIGLMHMQGEPSTMQDDPHYTDVVADVWHFLKERIEQCEAHGIAKERLLIDPGFGFGKRVEHNLQII